MSLKDIPRVIETSSGMIKQIENLSEIFRPFKPEVRRLRVDYFNRNSELKYYLNIPDKIIEENTRSIIEFPVTPGFIIDEVIDFEAQQIFKPQFNPDRGKWRIDVSEFPTSEKYMVTLKGKMSTEFLDRLVDVKCAINPTMRENGECYWIHSALKDVSIFDKVWSELDIEQVNIDVRIGVERYFSSLIPPNFKKINEAKNKLLEAVRTGQRDLIRLETAYRRISQKSEINPSELVNLFMKLASGEMISPYLKLDKPFFFGNIQPEKELTALIPEKVRVNVLSDLNFKNPIAKGELLFERKKYEENITKEIEYFSDS